MSKTIHRSNGIGYRLRRSFAHLITGGDWAVPFPDEIQHNLHRFWFDGLFASASDNIVINYLVLYILALGATRAQIGWTSSFSNLSAALLLLPGALLVERFHQRKKITLIFGGGVSRLALFFLALIPFMLSGSNLVLIAIALTVTRNACANLAYPAWVSITADLVPMPGRGRYFGSRNFVMGIAGMLTILLVGELITRIGQPHGYQLAMGLAFALGMTSTYYFSRLHEPQQAVPQMGGSLSLPALARAIRSHPIFLTLCATAAVWNFSLNVAGPFFSIYMVQKLNATPAMVGITSIVSSVSGLVVQRRLGRLADRWGVQRLQLISGLLIPILPFSWALVRSIWQIIPINVLGGIFWGAYNLASFNLLLELTPIEQRARFSALYQIIVTVALAAGAALGGMIVTRWGYVAIFVCSGSGRLLAALLFARFVRRPVVVEGMD